MNINWTNCWRGTFILLLMGVLCAMFEWKHVAQFFGFVGGVAFIIMVVIRFSDVIEFLGDY